MGSFRLAALIVLSSLATAVRPAAAEPPPVNTNGSGYAIGGYDVVAYFTAHAPTKGQKELAVQYRGTSWLFSSPENKARFQKAPESYLPAYEGYCAYGVANGRLVSIDPNAWTIYQGRLYLNYSLDIRAKWLEDRDGYIRKANSNWPGL